MVELRVYAGPLKETQEQSGKVSTVGRKGSCSPAPPIFSHPPQLLLLSPFPQNHLLHVTFKVLRSSFNKQWNL